MTFKVEKNKWIVVLLYRDHTSVEGVIFQHGTSNLQFV